jgi:phytoene dehydrogenase-like protein
VTAYGDFKAQFRDYARALDPLMANRPPRLKNMDGGDKLTLAKLGWKLRFGLGADAMQEFLRVGGINMYDVLNETFQDERLKGALAADAVLGHHMGPRTPNTVLTYLHRLRGELHGAMTLPPGGMGQVATALAEAARNAGATIRTSAPVRRIQVADGRATGVELEDGETLTADIVVSNADAKTTFLQLVGAPELDAMFAHRIHKTRVRGNVAKLHLALSALPASSGLDEKQLGQRLLIAPDMRYVEHAFNHAKYGEYSAAPVLEITLPSIADPNLAPAGHHVMSISVNFAPYRLKAGWENTREDFTNTILTLLEQYAPGLSSQVVASELLTPVDIEQRYRVSGGNWHHGEMSIDQSFMMRPVHGSAQYNTPVDGLFLCGAATHPGGGINGTAGRNAARRILAMSGGKAQ